MKIYYVARIESYYETDECGYPYSLDEIITEEEPLLDKGIFANAADAVALCRNLLQEENAKWESYADCDPVIVGNRVYPLRKEMKTFPANFTEYAVREREVIGS